MTRRRWRALTTAVAAAVVLVGCTRAAAPTAADSAAWRTQVGEFSDAHGPLAVPRELPPHLARAQPLTLDGQPAVTFSVPGEPLVTVCSGDLQRCRAALGASREVRTGRADGLAFVVALGAREEPGSTPTLTAAAGSFWDDVAMTSSRPSWLAVGESR